MELIGKQKRILVLDKDGSIMPVVDEMLNYGDWDIKTTYDPHAVYNMAKEYQPDLVLLDYLLLDKDCELICQDFKADVELEKLPIIIITRYRTKKASSDSYKCDALFIKPMDMEVLASRIEYLMAS